MPRFVFDPATYDIANLIVSEPEERELPNNKGKYHTLEIKSKTPDGKEVPLIFALEGCNSFGIKKWTGDDGGISYTMGISLEGKDDVISCMQRITDAVKDAIIDKRKKLKKPTLEKSHLDQMRLAKFPEDADGNPIMSRATMNIKLKTTNQDKDKNPLPEPRITTRFFSEDEVDEQGEALEVKPEEYIDRRCTVTAFIRINSIFFGPIIRSFQCKLEECHLRPNDSSSNKNLMQVYKAMKNLDIAPPATNITTEDPLKASFDDEEAEAKSSSSEDEESQPEPTPTPASRRGRARK